MQSQNLCLTYSLVLGRQNTLLRNTSRCNVCPPFIDWCYFMPNCPHKSDFLPRPQQVPDPIDFVVPWKITLPFHRGVIDPLGSHSDKAPFLTFKPSPLVRVPSKGVRFAIENCHFLFPLLFFALWWYEWFSLHEKDLPFPQSGSPIYSDNLSRCPSCNIVPEEAWRGVWWCTHWGEIAPNHQPLKNHPATLKQSNV